MTGRGERLNLTSDPDAASAEAPASTGDAAERSHGAASRPFVAIHFMCCGVYTRIYLNRAGTAYFGSCPKCCRPATVHISDDGTDCRSFFVH